MDSSASLMEMLGVDLPIVQAPIGSVATVDLVAEVGRAGGIGGLALTWTDPATAVAQVRALKQRVGKRFFVNYVLRFPPTSLDAILAEGISTVTLSWGLDTGLIARIRMTGARVGVQVGHPLGAKRAKDAGADFIIAQGSEAGGHVQSTMSLSALLEGLRETAAGVPTIAAGGLSTAACVDSALAAGASAAMLGTRFIASAEANAHASYKLAIVNAKPQNTVLTNCFDGEWPYATVRVLRNNTFEEWEASGCPIAPHRPGEGDTVGQQNGGPIIRYSGTPPRADATGDPLAACLYAGTSVDGIDDIPGAFDLVRRLRPRG